MTAARDVPHDDEPALGPERARAADQRWGDDVEARLALSSIGLWRWRAADDAFDVDAVTAAHLGRDPATDLTIADVESGFDAAHRGRLAIALHACALDGASFEIEVKLARGDRHPWVMVRGGSLGDDVVGGIVADVTRLKEREAVAEREAQFLRASVEAGRLGHWHRDLATGDATRSPVLDDVFGLGPEVIGWSREQFLSFLHPDDHAEAAAAFQHTMETGEDWEFELRIVRADGEERWVWARGGLHLDEEGRPDRLIGVVRDVTDRRHIEEELRAATTSLEAESNWLEAILDLMPIPFVLIEPSSERVTFANRAAEIVAEGNFLPVTGTEGTIPPGLCLYADGTPVRAEDMPAQRLARGERLQDLELIWRVDGRSHHLLLHGETLPGMFGRPPVSVCTFQDIGRLKEIETALREADQRKDDFIATLGHELRNPLSPISNGLELLAMLPAGGPETAEIRAIMSRQVRHMTRLIDDLLDISRISKGKIDLRPEPTDVNEAVEHAIEATRPLMSRAGHKLELSKSESALTVLADPVRLTQVVTNLLSNAAKFTPPRGLVTVTTAREGHDAVLRVIDHGVGIERDRLTQVFEPFAQVGSPQHVGEGGLGIGLTLVKRLVRLLGGEVVAESEGPGKGATFVVRLPTYDGPMPRDVRPQAEQHERPSFRVLVVDDSRPIVHLFTRLLAALGHDARGAASGEEALAVLEEFHPEVVFSDVLMPVMNGYELAALMKNRPGPSPTLVAMTGFGRSDDRDRAIDAGFDHHVAKPADVRRLQTLLDEIAAERRRQGLL